MFSHTIALCFTLAGSFSANVLENPSFEAGSGDSAVGWLTDTRKGEYRFVVADNAHSGRRCLAIEGVKAGWGRWHTRDAFLVEGATYRISCWVRTDGTGTGQVWMPECGVSLRFNNKPKWTRVEAEFSAKSTRRHGVYLQSFSLGTVFFDDLAIELIKGSVDASTRNAENKVDGLSGATLTSRGVSNLVQFWMGDNGYKLFLENLRAGEA